MSEKKTELQDENVHDYGVEWKPADSRTNRKVLVVLLVGCVVLVGLCLVWEIWMPAR
ncbi:MAG: hypothetical protein K8H88_22760 [Sandaracinaceae bacterium]|nr:hypothetical protein [Sandaracinaceae bacterium]